jgi:beta-phosphoglucomutase-like phosphatase (HAD superfamily)
MVFSLDGVFVDTQNILLKTFTSYAKKKFPNKSFDPNNCKDYNLIQLFEEIKFEEFFQIKYPKLEMQKSLERESENEELRKHIRKINNEICENLTPLKIYSENIEQLKKLKDEGAKLSLYSQLDASVTLAVLKELRISSFFDIIFSRNDILELPPKDDVLKNISLFFGCALSELKIISKNELIIEMAKGHNLEIKPSI